MARRVNFGKCNVFRGSSWKPLAGCQKLNCTHSLDIDLGCKTQGLVGSRSNNLRSSVKLLVNLQPFTSVHPPNIHSEWVLCSDNLKGLLRCESRDVLSRSFRATSSHKEPYQIKFKVTAEGQTNRLFEFVEKQKWDRNFDLLKSA